MKYFVKLSKRRIRRTLYGKNVLFVASEQITEEIAGFGGFGRAG